MNGFYYNARTVDRLAQALSARGITVWPDRKDIQPGERWQEAVREPIQNSSLFIARFSQQYYERDDPYMNEELTIAIDRLRTLHHDRIWFVPILLSRCRPPDNRISDVETLSNPQCINLYKNWNKGISEIAKCLQSRLDGKREHSTKEKPGGQYQLISVGDEDFRAKAVRELSKALGTDAVHVLHQALRDESTYVRNTADKNGY